MKSALFTLSDGTEVNFTHTGLPVTHLIECIGAGSGTLGWYDGYRSLAEAEKALRTDPYLKDPARSAKILEAHKP